jgi:hypothetical protein
MTIRRSFGEEGDVTSIMGYHGIVTTNPEYNFTSQDLNMLADMARREAVTLYWDNLDEMGYEFNGTFWDSSHRRERDFRRMVERMVTSAMDEPFDPSPGQSDFEAFRLRERDPPYWRPSAYNDWEGEGNWFRLRGFDA